MVEPLDPLPLDDVLDIVERRRQRRQRLVLRGALGAGAVVAAGVGVRAAASDGDGTTPTTIAPAGTGTTPPTEATAPVPELVEPWQQAALERYLRSDLGPADAEELAALWDVEPLVTKVLVGELLRSGSSPAVGEQAATEVQGELLGAYFDAGLTYDDALALGEAWGVEAFDAKLLAGVRLAAGEDVGGGR